MKISRLGLGVACLCVASVAVRVLGGCSDSSSNTDGGAEGGIATCGNAPYANVNARLTSFTTGLPIQGATVTIDPGPCPGVEATSDSNGVASARIELDAAVNGRVQTPGYLTERVGEQVYRGDFDGGVFLAPTVAAGVLPHFNATTPDVLAILYGASGDGGAACTSVSGATFSVAGHPEAVITYYQPAVDGGLPAADSALTATTSAGAAEISGLAASQSVQLQVSAPTCTTASFVSYPLTGKYYVENGVITVAEAFLVPTP